MKNKKVIVHSLGHAVLVFIYVFGVAQIMFNGQRLFGQVHDFWGPVIILMLFVFSAAVVGTLVLGRPILLYFSGAKSEALKFFGYTLGWLFLITLLIAVSHISR